MSTNFQDVGAFHQKFDLHAALGNGIGPQPEEPGLMEYRVAFLYEEMTELETAIAEGNIAEVFDALLDLTYVAMGTAHLLGLPWQAGWDEVQRANITKERAAADGSNSKRGSSFDVIKPAGWQGPDIGGVLAEYGF